MFQFTSNLKSKMAMYSQVSLWLLLVICSSILVQGGPEDDDACNTVNINRTDPTGDLSTCKLCVKTFSNKTASNNATCLYVHINTGFECRSDFGGELANDRCSNTTECDNHFGNSNITTTSTTTTAGPTTTISTTTNTPITTTNGSTTTAATTTTAAPTPTTPTTASTTTHAPSNATTTAAPSHNDGGGVGWGSFFGGIAFTLAMASVAYIAWRFYKARTERNYHTFPSSRFAPFC